MTRQGNQLYERWGTDTPVEILPGKFDTFFTPGIPILERFVRDRRGRVVGIVRGPNVSLLLASELRLRLRRGGDIPLAAERGVD